MSEKSANPVLKQVLELGPVIGFFVAFFLLKEESYQLFGSAVKPFTFITFWFVIAMVACMGALWWVSGRLSNMQVMTLGLVVVMGGLTVWLDNDVFLKLKPTILYALFAGILWIGLQRGKLYLAMLLENVFPMTEAGWTVLTKRFLWFFIGLAVGNAVIAFVLPSGVWVTVKTFGLPLAMFVFIMLQWRLAEQHALDETDSASKP